MSGDVKPRLLPGLLTGKAYITTDYKVRSDGVILANVKHEVPPRDLLDCVYAVGVRGSALDEVARVLGFVPLNNAHNSPEADR